MTAYKDIPLNMSKGEQEFLITHAKKAQYGMIEIGSCWGKSSIDLGRVAKANGDLLICVDHWEGEAFYNGWLTNIREAGLGSDILPIHMRSNDAIGVIKKHFSGDVDFLFIDGDHSYEGVKADWDNWMPLLTRPAIVVFHDIEVPCFGVKQLYTELCKEYSHTEKENIGAIYLQ